MSVRRCSPVIMRAKPNCLLKEEYIIWKTILMTFINIFVCSKTTLVTISFVAELCTLIYIFINLKGHRLLCSGGKHPKSLLCSKSGLMLALSAVHK